MPRASRSGRASPMPAALAPRTPPGSPKTAARLPKCSLGTRETPWAPAQPALRSRVRPEWRVRASVARSGRPPYSARVYASPGPAACARLRRRRGNSLLSDGRIMARSITVILFTLTTVTLGAQSPSEFEAASIKRHPPNDFTISMRSMPDGITAVNIPMRVFVGSAYPAKTNRYLGLPAWVEQERYDVAARIPAGATREQVTAM